MALVVLSFAGCRTTGPIAQSSTDFRLQNIEAALVKIQGEVQALESKQAEGDKNWGEVRTKLDELALLLRSRTGAAGAASVQDAPPPWAGQPMAANHAAASKAAAGPGEKNAAPYAPPGKSAASSAQNGKGQPAPSSDVGRPFPATPPGQTAQAVQAAASAAPTPPPAQKNQEPTPPSPAAELAAAGLSAPAPVSAVDPNAKIIVLTASDDNDFVYETLEHGANAYVLKGSNPDELFLAMAYAMDDDLFISPHLARIIVKDYLLVNRQRKALPPMQSLTAREKEIVRLIIDGKKSKQIAETLFISIKTVDKHRSNILGKLGINSCNELRHGSLFLTEDDDDKQ